MKNRSFLTFLVFLVISTTLWLFVKLSEEYTTQVVFLMRLDEVPTDKWLSSPEQTVKLSLTTDGFHILRYKMMREHKRVVGLSLEEVPFRQEKGNSYSFSSLYVTEKVAELLGVGATDLTMNDALVYFNMDSLKSKVVPVTLRTDIRPQRQYGVYGIPVLEPSSITVYGPEDIIDTLQSVSTQLLHKSSVSESFCETVPLDFYGDVIRSEVSSVNVSVQVEKYTEVDVSIQIAQPDSVHVRFFPDVVTVKCLVAIKDYSGLSSEAFRVEVDDIQLKDLRSLLDLKLTLWPQYVQVLSITPEKVEYLIVQ